MTDEEGRAMGLSMHDIEQAKKFGGSVKRSIDDGSHSDKMEDAGQKTFGESVSEFFSGLKESIFGSDENDKD